MLKSVGTKLLVVFLSSILLIASSVYLLMYFTNSSLLSSTLQEETKNSLFALVTKSEDLKASSLEITEKIALQKEFITALETNNTAFLRNAATSALSVSSKADFILFVDADGMVIARTDNNKTGYSLNDHGVIASALSGLSGSSYIQDEEVVFAICSATPIKSTSGQIIGAVSAGYLLDNELLVDDLKRSHGTEFTIFKGNVRINTTIQENGVRKTGTKLNEKVASIVLEQKKNYNQEADILGQPFYTAYTPILDDKGDVIGSFFAGKNVQNIKNAENASKAWTIFLVIVFCIIMLFASRIATNIIIVRPVKQMSLAAEQLSKGNLKAEIQRIKSSGEIGLLAKALQNTIYTLSSYIKDIENYLDSISRGDLCMETVEGYVGDFIPIQNSINRIVQSLNHTISSINTTAVQVNEGAVQVSSASQSLAAGATEQASSIEQLSSSIEKVSHEIKSNDANVQQAAVYMDETWKGVVESDRRMQKMLTTMEKISLSSSQISDIIKVIEDIASQTNLLALNAAIEAARAGAAGKGFSVVADEVRNLAAKSTQSAKQTAELIKMSIASVSEGTAAANDTAQELSMVSSKTMTVKDIFQKIRDASEQQAVAIEQITQGINQMAKVVQTNAAASEESAATSEELSAQAAMLKDEVGKFRLSESKSESFSAAASHVISDPNAAAVTEKKKKAVAMPVETAPSLSKGDFSKYSI